jgi:hypothetical protein
MVVRVPELTGYGVLRHVYISVPYAADLIDGVKYMERAPPAEIRSLRRLRYQNTPRAPSLQRLVKLALECNDAEELGKRIRQRYERQQRRAGSTGGSPQADAEDERVLDRLLTDAIG